MPSVTAIYAKRLQDFAPASIFSPRTSRRGEPFWKLQRDGNAAVPSAWLQVNVPPSEIYRKAGDSGVAVAQEFAGRCAGGLAFFEGRRAVDDDRAVAPGVLDAAPFAARKIVLDLADPFGLDSQPRHLVHDHVGPGALAQDAAVAKAGRVRGQGGEPVMRLFQSDQLLVADQPAQKVSGEGPAAEELGVRAAVRRAREGEGRSVGHLGGVFGVETAAGAEELDLEVAGD